MPLGPPIVSDKKDRLIQAAVALMLNQGYAATSVDDICAAAGVTKGAFFHYFKSKEEACRAAMEAWGAGWQALMDEMERDTAPEPIAQLEGLFRMMPEAYLNSPVGPGCMIGTVAQEMGSVNDPLRSIFVGHFQDWVDRTAKMLAEAKQASPPVIDFDPEEMAWWLQSMVQGTLLISKSRRSEEFIRKNVAHCRRYVMSHFGRD